MDQKASRLLYLIISLALAAAGYYYFFLPARRRNAELRLVESEADLLAANAQTQIAQAEIARKRAQQEEARRNGLSFFQSEYNPKLRQWLRGHLWTKKPGKDHYWIHDRAHIEWLQKNLASKGVQVFQQRYPDSLPLGWVLVTDGNRPGKEVLTIPTPSGNVTVINPQSNYPKVQFGVTP